ncbi:MAG TPA: L,D-transpeptidase family protein, partial [Dongiaceae bacterium]|nr:L,D-transpeptidase family protein [Dongiaceae bacterium]
PQAAYQGLREGLRKLYAIAEKGGWEQLPDGPSLKPGMRDARVPLLRQRMMAAGLLTERGPGSTHFDEILSDSVKQFQREQYLDADGAVGKDTRAALNIPVEVRIDQIRANLERGRWLLHEAKGNFVLVDVAGFRIYYYRDGQPVWNSRVQVGKPYRSTPIFKSRVTYFTFNPTWTIPPTIFKEDVLPHVRKDPEYLAKNNWQVLDSAGKPLDPAGIDWNHPGNILLRQASGPTNPLGQVVIRFPNPYAVYLHDTTAKGQFGRGQRAFSSGCIRVERPLELVELLLNDPNKWSREQIDTAIATGNTRDLGLVTPVPILLAYYTVAIGSDGRVQYKQDIYSRDPELVAALNRQVK